MAKGKIATEFGLGEDTFFKGVLRFDNSLRISGKFEGSIESDGFLYVEKGAEISADIHVNSVIVGGTIHGDIRAEDNLVMLESGKVFGNIETGCLKANDGFEFKGKCEMINDRIPADIFSITANQLRKSLNES
ncbi:MAG: polymer-forming cytoskeletal protein [Spirochaetales bacterium]|nr:polymer-forming cytoskeletal protein [Spirochaetales bacterium]